MKRELILIALTMCTLTYIFAQQDLQWVILNGKGKDGLKQPSTSAQNNYPPGNVITNDTFNISGYYHPQTSIGKNCLFVIYNDGTYFNSREISKTDFFTPPLPWPSGLSSHSLVVPSGKSPMAMYTTRNYEGDDPPGTVRVHNNPQPGDSIYTMRVTNGKPIITANHDVLRNRDITLIIDIDSLRTLHPGVIQCTLRYDKLQRISDRSVEKFSKCFTPSPIFERNNTFRGGYPLNVYSEVQDSPYVLIHLNMGNEYFFLNLRPSTEINDKYHDASGNHSHDALFELIAPNGDVLVSGKEHLLDAYDPNLLIVESVCSNKNGFFVTYYIEFENTGTSATTDVSVSLVMPSDIDRRCPPKGEWVLGTRTHSIKVERKQGTLNYKIFPSGSHSLPGCGKIDTVPIAEPAACTGVLKLTLKLNRNVDSQNVTAGPKLTPDSCFVHFGENRTPLEIKTHVEVIIPNPFGLGPGNKLDILRPIEVKNCLYQCNNPLRDILLAVGGLIIVILSFVFFQKNKVKAVQKFEIKK